MKKINRRSFLKAAALCGAGAAAASMAACGSASSAATAAPASSTAASAAAGAASASGKKVEFTWIHHMEEEGKQDWVKHSADEYMKQNPNVTIDIEMIPNDDFLTTLKTRIASDDAPMIFDLDRVNTIDFQEAGHLADVSDTEGLEKNFDANILAQGQVDGVQCGVPLDVSAYGIFYNKDIFDKYGLKIPTTADELTKVCDTLAQNGVQPLGAPFSESWCQKHFCYAYTYIYCVENNADWFSQKMALTSTFASDDAFKSAISEMATYKKYWGDDPFSTSWNDVLSGIATGTIAMTINGSWTIAGILSINPDANIGTFAMPVSNDTAQTQLRIEPGNNFCVYNSSDADLLAAAKGFYTYLCSVESAEYYAKAANGLTGCTVDVETIAPVNDINAYKGDQVYEMIAITEFNAEYLTSFNDTTTKYLQADKFDVDGYAAALDSAFTAIK